MRGRLTYANVMATLGVFLALGGTAVGAVIVSSNDEIAPNTIYGANLPAGKNDNIVGGSIGSSDLASSAVINSKLAAGAVGSGKLADKAVIAGKLGDGAVALTNLASGAVATSKLLDGAVTLRKLDGDVIDRIDSHTGTASQFTGTQPQAASNTIVKTVAGLTVSVTCQSDSSVQLAIQASDVDNFDASGTASFDSTPIVINNEAGSGFVITASFANFDVVARNRDVGNFVRLDLHASASSGGCPYWGVTQVATG
jgi:hypothetical protein